MKRRRWFDIHSWIGVVSGVLMFVVCWSGAVAVYSHELDAALDPRTRAAAAPLAWEALHASVRREFPDATNITLRAPLRDGYAAQAVIDLPNQSMVRVFLDPSTTAVRGRTSYFDVQRFFRSLHMSLFDLGSGRGWGYWVVGALGPLLLVSALSPLIFYRRWWRGFFTLKRGRGARVFWSDLHKLMGVWTLAFAVLMGVTGTWYLSEWMGADFDYPPREPVESAATNAPALPLGSVLARVRADWPQLDIRSVTTPDGSYWGPVVYVDGQTDAWLVRDRANFAMADASTGAIVRRQTAASVGWPARWVDTVDPLHFGDFGGLAVKAIWFVFGLALAALCLTGAYLHVQRIGTAAGRARVGWRGTNSAVAVTWVLLGIAAWGCAKEVRGYGPVVDGVATWPDVPAAVLAFLGAWVAVTLAIVAAWSWAVCRR